MTGHTYRKKLYDLQYLMYAEDKRSLLICLQGRDAAGKDGSAISPSPGSSSRRWKPWT